jgi:hypothetical protein
MLTSQCECVVDRPANNQCERPGVVESGLRPSLQDKPTAGTTLHHAAEEEDGAPAHRLHEEARTQAQAGERWSGLPAKYVGSGPSLKEAAGLLGQANCPPLGPVAKEAGGGELHGVRVGAGLLAHGLTADSVERALVVRVQRTGDHVREG